MKARIGLGEIFLRVLPCQILLSCLLKFLLLRLQLESFSRPALDRYRTVTGEALNLPHGVDKMPDEYELHRVPRLQASDHLIEEPIELFRLFGAQDRRWAV